MISTPFQPDEYVCVHNYKPLSKTEIGLRKGARVLVVEKNLNGWWFVDSPSEGQGYVPKCVLKPLKEANDGSNSNGRYNDTNNDDDNPIPTDKSKILKDFYLFKINKLKIKIKQR